MLDRRRVVQGGLAALGSLSLAAPLALRAQGKPPVKIRYNEVVRSLLYAPAYVAITKGYFKDAGLDVTLTTANGGDKSMAALMSGSADIALIGPETAIYVLNSDSSTKFAHLLRAHRDRRLHAGRPREGRQVRLEHAQGQGILGFRPGSTPLLFFEEAMRMNGIDPHKDVKLNNNVAIPARVGSWLAGQTNTPSSSSRMPRSSSSTARPISWPRSARPSASPITRRSWRPTSTSRTIRR